MPSMFYDVFGDGIDLFDCYGISGFRRAIVIHEKQRDMRTDRDFANQAVVGLFVAESPAAMDIYQCRQRFTCSLRSDDANWHRSGGAGRDYQILKTHGWL